MNYSYWVDIYEWTATRHRGDFLYNMHFSSYELAQQYTNNINCDSTKVAYLGEAESPMNDMVNLITEASKHG